MVASLNDIINIAISLPTEILGAAKSFVTDAANVFNDIEDGSIVSDLAKVRGIVVSDIMAGWGDLASAVADGWHGFSSDIDWVFGNCPTAATTVAGGELRLAS